MMNEQEKQLLLFKLEQRLGLVLDEDTENQMEIENTEKRMEMALMNAEEELRLYLNCCKLPGILSGKLVELAAIDFRQAQARGSQPVGVKSSSFSEGDVSQSVTYMTAQDVQAAKDSILKSIAHYRRRATWR